MARRLTLALLGICFAAYGQTVRVKLSGQLKPVQMDIEEYVAAALAGEAGGFKSIEALKAMAVAARTFARSSLTRHRSEGYDLCETTHCQDLRVSAVNGRHRSAAEATQGLVLWYNGRPARIFYTEHCGGHTESAASVWPRAAAPYLRGVKDDFCLSAGNRNWTVTYVLADLARAFRLPSLETIEIGRRTSNSRAATILLNGRSYTAESFYIATGRQLGWNRLRSTLFTIEVRGDEAVFSGAGRGHGVGLCQTGAEQRGLAGHDFRRILAAYFPGTRIGVAARDIAWVSSKSGRADILATSSAPAGPLTAAVERAIAHAESLTGLKLQVRPEIR
ncbi:MAG TPA: SpoIID/LytB domain-containing protein, partial [Bryobacteraceae bacterium]|nr:SpoIID/LytB domain-containing protein [Bryobacteraceae bacterium]